MEPEKLQQMQDAAEDLVRTATGLPISAAIPWTDTVNADPIADLKAWKQIVEQSVAGVVNRKVPIQFRSISEDEPRAKFGKIIDVTEKPS